jgi:YD repeat-containing protein
MAGGTVTLGYDTDGRLTSLAEPDSANLSIAYDGGGR